MVRTISRKLQCPKKGNKIMSTKKEETKRQIKLLRSENRRLNALVALLRDEVMACKRVIHQAALKIKAALDRDR